MSFFNKYLFRKRAANKLSKVNVTTVSSMLITAIEAKVPYFAGRMGWYESYAINQYDSKGFASYEIIKKLRTNAGVFPEDYKTFMYFHKNYLDALAAVDLLGLMESKAETSVLTRYHPKCTFCELPSLEPYLHPSPWSKALLGLKVLVVHPFANSISNQYHKNREHLFVDPAVLPEFQLDTLAPPQTTGSLDGGYDSWESALQTLCNNVSRRDFDVAIIGCGAYGFPLGSHIKALGKVAIHLGGATQLLFGISGNRWRSNPAFTNLINERWRPPTVEEKPEGWEKIEDGCYW